MGCCTFNRIERVNGGAFGVRALYALRPPQLSVGSLIRSYSHVILVVASVATGGTGAAALPLNPFRYEGQAQRHCLVILSSGSIFEKGSIISSDKIATRGGLRGALYVAKKPEPAAFAARCWGFVKSIVN